MKKLVFTAALFFALTASAQERKFDGDAPKKPNAEMQMKRFDNLNLTSSQKRKIKALFKERDAQFEKNKMAHTQNERFDGKRNPEMEKKRNEFDQKLQRILTREQYAKFKSGHEKMGFKENPKNDKGFEKPKERG